MNQSFADQIKAARSANTPLLAIETVDNIAAIQRIMAALSPKTPFIQWDIVRGWTKIATVIDGAIVENKAGEAAMAGINGKNLINPVASLEEAVNLPGKSGTGADFKPGSVLFLHNAHEFLKDEAFTQAIMNLRDEFKQNMRTLILLGTSFALPGQLAQHVMILNDPLPTAAELDGVLAACGDIKLDATQKVRAIKALTGLPRFAAEGAVMTSLDVNGTTTLNFERLWARKEKMISETRGLAYQMGGCTFADMLGNTEAADFGRAVNNGRRRPEAIVLLDEGEDQAGGHKSDSSGVSQKMIGKMATELQERKYRGQVNFGIHGCGKSLFAKAMAGDAGIPLITMTLGEIEDSLVGSSNKYLAQALDVINTVSNGNAYWIMTTNDLHGVPTKIRDRFSYGGVWMFDMPKEDGVAALFEFYLKRKGLESYLPDVSRLDLRGWTPRNVEWCVEKAWDLNLDLAQAAQRVIPYGKANAPDVEAIRRQAHGKYLSADKPGAYQFEEVEPVRAMVAAGTGRTLNLEV